MTGLERGYRWLLLAYPAWYRQERGDEMLDTSLAVAADGRIWPSPRDAGALILGGLRVRAGLDRRLPTATSVRLAVLLGVAVWLARDASGALTYAVWAGLRPVSFSSSSDAVPVAIFGLLVLAAALTAWFAPRRVTAAVSLAAAAACAYQGRDGSWWSLLGEPAMLAALALLALGRERMPRSWLWLLGAELADQPLEALAGWGRPAPLHVLYPWTNDLPWVIVAAVVLWAVVDARPAIAVGVSLVLDRGITFITSWPNTEFGPLTWFLPLAIGVVLVLLMAPWLRRQAVL